MSQIQRTTTTKAPFAGASTWDSQRMEKEMQGVSDDVLIAAMNTLYSTQMYADAYALVKYALTSAETSERVCVSAVWRLSDLWRSQADYNEIVDLIEKGLERFPNSLEMRRAVVTIYLQLPQTGEMIDGKFVIKQTWGENTLSWYDRKRVRILQIYRDGLATARELGALQQDNSNVSEFYLSFINVWTDSQFSEYWRLQTLTDIDVTPDYQPAERMRQRNRMQGAPVDDNGDPIFYLTPESFESAKNDGERIQALRKEAFEYASKYGRARLLRQQADDVQALFGVQTLADYRFFFDRQSVDSEQTQSSIWTLNTLEDNETIARLATGLKRFKLPQEYDYIALWRESLEYNVDYHVWTQVALEYENRRQYVKAAEVWRHIVDILNGSWGKELDKNLRDRYLMEATTALAQIEEPRIRFEHGDSKVTGTQLDMTLTFRNATEVEYTVNELRVDKLLDQLRQESFWKEGNGTIIQERVMSLLMADNMTLNDRIANSETYRNLRPLGIIGRKHFIGKEVARFKQTLEPNPEHYDRRVRVETPQLPVGAYLIQAKAKDGNSDIAVVWLRDRALVSKAFQTGRRYFLYDSVTGEPLADKQIEFLIVYRSYARNRNDVSLVKLNRKTDQTGSVLLENNLLSRDNGSVMVIATSPSTDSKRPQGYTFLDGDHVWVSNRVDVRDNDYRRAFFVSDRPIYRPGQRAEFKFIIGTPSYDAPEDSTPWANQTVDYVINNPMGERVAHGQVTLDSTGSFAEGFDIPNDSKLGRYSVIVGTGFDESNGSFYDIYGSGAFRLEEYRKPEFEVKVEAPSDPVTLGETFSAKVNARYYFGAPVTKGTVNYKVVRKSHYASWFPTRYWDWFYGCGYWQFAYEAKWYPGWTCWGVRRLLPFEMRGSYGVPEIVCQGEAQLDENGSFSVQIDSSLAKAIYPNDDQEYEIEAEVVDESRRVITGKGKVYVAREPFQTYVWFDRGYYKVNDKMVGGFQARRIDGKPVQGKVVAKLYRVTYQSDADGQLQPQETEVYGEELTTDENGSGQVSMTATEPGQYRFSCVVTTQNGLVEEGGQLIQIRGQERSESTTLSQARGDFRFNALEIIPDKPEYSVGDVAHIQLASNRANGYVMFLTRSVQGIPENDVPQFIKLENGVAYVDVEITAADQPNIFVEAATLFENQYYTEQKELVVPPEKRVLDVAVEPVQERVKPGAKATVKLRLTDLNGNPVIGHVVTTIYDKSLEYVSGGSNVGDIREFFWKWRRNSYLQSNTSLQQSTLLDVFHQFDKGAQGDRLQSIGIFGGVEPEGAMAPMGAMGGGVRVYKNTMNRAPRAFAVADSAMRSNAMADGEEVYAMEEVADMAGGMSGAISAAAPAAAPTMSKSADFDQDDAVTEKKSEDKPLVEATVRSNLADLAYWAADLTPEDDGVIEIEVDMPDNLTTWKIMAWSVGSGLRVGSGESEIITSKDVIIRMQKPRFLTQKDEVVLSANIHNYLSDSKKTRVSLEFPTDGLDESNVASLVLLDPSSATQEVEIPANGQARVDWLVRAETPGTVKLLMKALTDEESDAIADKLTVKEHGIDKQVATSGVLPAIQNVEQTREAHVTVVVPQERRPETTKFTLRYSPTLAGAVLDAIPYLCEYPYGCTEQTLNKFLPLVLAQHALIDCGVDLATLKDKRVNLNAQELGDATQRAQQWGKTGYRRVEPVFDEEEVRARAKAGIERLQSMQNSDGGWGWFYGAHELSSPRLTSLVVRGLTLARQNDQEVDDTALERGIEWLRRYQREQATRIIHGKLWDDETKKHALGKKHSLGWKLQADSQDAFVYYVLTSVGVIPAEFSESYIDVQKASFARDVTTEQVAAVMKEFLWESHSNLELYPLSTYALALTMEPTLDDETSLRIETVLRMLAQYRHEDAENQTVWLDLTRYPDWRYWGWYSSEYETQAFYLKLLLRVAPQTLEKLGLAKDAPQLVKYLLNNRKHATYWNSTRDTAICIEAFVEYMRTVNELSPTATVELYLDGEKVKTTQYTPETLFVTDGTLEIPSEALSSGEHDLTIRITGNSPLYYNSYLEYFTLEDPILKTGLEVKVERRYYKLQERKDATTLVEGGHGQAVSQRVEQYDRIPLKDGDEVQSGELVEVELIVDSKNDYDSILVEDFKPAGYEAVDQLSGYNGNALHAYVEYRDDRVCYFATSLPQGRVSVKYRLRAETPGKFSALPTKIWGMYAPELKGNADEFKANVTDRPLGTTQE
ncbi:MAG: alpha-2-macroglobulin family protein [Planctomycetia bacterium]|nr:alpha-2-macroglobulin family protein [Planctomycetia bacterium]